jgi:hypothetical protein
LQSDRSWWLSAFYSLCIQSFVRKYLIDIVNGILCNNVLGTKRYLHVVLRLFLASSGGYDPIVSERPQESAQLTATEDNCHIDHIKLAQAAVEHHDWAERGIQSSRDYLSGLFEDDEALENLQTCDSPAASPLVENNDLQGIDIGEPASVLVEEMWGRYSPLDQIDFGSVGMLEDTTISDVYSDELFGPNFTFTDNQSSTFSENLQNQPHVARSESPFSPWGGRHRQFFRSQMEQAQEDVQQGK